MHIKKSPAANVAGDFFACAMKVASRKCFDVLKDFKDLNDPKDVRRDKARRPLKLSLAEDMEAESCRDRIMSLQDSVKISSVV